jgi:hypothetical protein
VLVLALSTPALAAEFYIVQISIGAREVAVIEVTRGA